jgi:hypothetical protein
MSREKVERDAAERKRKRKDVQKSSTVDQSEYPTDKSSYPVIQSQQMHQAISTDHQYSVCQPLSSILSFS